MNRKLKKEEKLLLEALTSVFEKDNKCNNEKVKSKIRLLTKEEMNNFIMCADLHKVLPLLYDFLLDMQEDLSENIIKRVDDISKKTVLQNYRLLILNKNITDILKNEGIKAITLKGAVTASRYTVPEYRKSGDVDIFIGDESDYKKTINILTENGLEEKKEQHASHHVELKTKDGISVEIHNDLTESFNNTKIDSYIKKVQKEFNDNIQENSYWGFSLYEPKDAYHLYYLMLHMLQHFLREGFGLRNLCDWVVFINNGISDKDMKKLKELLSKSGMRKFAYVITKLCVEYLGLDKKKAAFIISSDIMLNYKEIDKVLFEIMESGDFGRKDSSRMLIIKNKNVISYVKEFHHQMHINFPKAGKIFLLWPLLWIRTLIIFMHNNKTVRNTTMRDVLKKAGDRSSVIKKLDLFK